jgi:hypothetical protein
MPILENTCFSIKTEICQSIKVNIKSSLKITNFHITNNLLKMVLTCYLILKEIQVVQGAFSYELGWTKTIIHMKTRNKNILYEKKVYNITKRMN